MGIPEKLRSVNGMLHRWKSDEKRLEKLFGAYDENDYSEGAEMLRNLSTAIAHAERFINAQKK